MTPQKHEQIDIGEVQLGKLFMAEYDFAIPDHQRPYAWAKDETLQLLDDPQAPSTATQTSLTSSAWSLSSATRN